MVTSLDVLDVLDVRAFATRRVRDVHDGFNCQPNIDTGAVSWIGPKAADSYFRSSGAEVPPEYCLAADGKSVVFAIVPIGFVSDSGFNRLIWAKRAPIPHKRADRACEVFKFLYGIVARPWLLKPPARAKFL
jgi:hypothetical protein